MMPIRRETPSTVNGSLTPKRPRRVVENDQFAAFVRRVIRAHSRRVTSGDIESLTDLAAMAIEIDNATNDAVHGLRAYGYSWTEIGARLGITRQAAQQRFGGETR